MTSKILIPAALMILTLALGLWLAVSGKPYKNSLFTPHKLLALAAVVLIVIRVVNLMKGSPVQALLIALIVLACLCVLALFGTGVLMSIQKTFSANWPLIHGIAAFLLLGSSSGLIYLLL
jgi:cytochrome b